MAPDQKVDLIFQQGIYNIGVILTVCICLLEHFQVPVTELEWIYVTSVTNLGTGDK